MSFENAKKGIGQIFTAEILNLIGAIFAILGLIIGAVGVVALVGGAMAAADGAMMGGLAGSIGGGALALIGGIFALIAFILYLVGIGNASKDEDSFKKAMMFVLLSLICSVVSAFTGTVPALYTVLSILAPVFELCATVFVINGIIVLAGKVGNAQVENKGQTVIKLIVVILVLSIIASLIGGIMSMVYGSAKNMTLLMVNGVTTGSIIASVLMVIATILQIISYFVYLSLLAQAKNMFN